MTKSFWQELGGTLFEEAGDALFLFDPETEQLRTVNPMAQRLSGLSSRELLELKISQLIRSEADGGLQRMRQAFRRTGVFHSQEGFWLRQRDGRWLPVNLTITRLHADSQIHGLVTARDISERREAQAKLADSELRYRTLFETSLQGIIIHQDGLIRFGNPALARMFGYAAVEELTGRDVWKTLVAPHEWPALHERAARFLAGEKLEPHPGWQGVRKDGSAIWIQATASVIPWNGRPAICAFYLDMTERKRAEEALQASESRHRFILEQVPAIIWTTDADLRITSSNGAGLAHIGEAPNQTVGLLMGEAVGNDDPAYLPNAAHLRALAGENVSYEMEFKGCAWRTHIEPLRDAAGGIIGTVGLCQDSTEQFRAEAALRESQRALATLMSNLPGMAYRCRNDADWTMELVSEGAAELSGYRPEELVGNHVVAFADLIHPADRDLVWREVQRGLAAQEPYRLEYRVRTRDGREKWVWEQGRGVFDANGALLALEGFITDVTERKLADQALRASEAKYRTLIENLTQSIFLKDRDLRFVAVNPPFCRAFERTAAEMIGQDDFAFSPPQLAEKYQADDRRVMQQRLRLEIEEQTMLHGELRTVQTVKTPVLDDNGEAVGVLGIFWDVTDQRNLEAQLRQAHKMEAVGQLAGGIAHDFNNLLTGILGNLSLALADLSESHPIRELLANAETAALRAAELTRQLLGFSRRTPLLSRPVDLNVVAEETVRLLRRTFDPRIEVQVRPAPNLWPVRADGGQMGQVLMNLCLNARDALKDGGTLTLETEHVHFDRGVAERRIEGRPGDFVHLRVSDTGVGMRPEVRERIFEPFFTTKEQGKGTGLGLAMVFGIVKQHQGWIDCRSEMGEGTTFDVYLPALPATAALPTNAPVSDGVRGGHETVLLADDEEVVGRLGETILRRHGYQVLTAMDGAEALELYRRHGPAIDLVILDLAMPRLSGPETLRELRKLDPAVRVLISSGYSTDENLRAVERDGVLGFVAKPYRPVELARQVRAALDKKR